MVDADLELLVTIISLTSAVFSPIVTMVVSSKKRKLQISFDHSKDFDSTTLVIRNTGSQSIFIDEIWLHKTQWIEYDLFERFSRNLSRPIVLNSGKTIRTIFAESELAAILNDAIKKGKVELSWPSYKERRLGFKVVINSSEGIGSTIWFKIGRREVNGKCHQYDFIGYRKSYYDLRRYYNSIDWGTSVSIPVFMLAFGAIAYYNNWTYDWIILIAGYVSLVVVSTIFVTDGLPNRNSVRKHTWILTITFAVMFWMIGAGMGETILFTIVIAAYHTNLISKYSGWNL